MNSNKGFQDGQITKSISDKGITMRLLIIVLCTFAFSANSMDFLQLGGTFSMHGNIEKDDAAKFVVEFASWEVPPTIFFISSKGGDLEEAIQIGDIIRASQIPVQSGEECFSACVFILSAGVEKTIDGVIGLHRPYFNKSYFANLTSLEAKEKYETLKANSEDYLKRMGVKHSLIERMFETDSTNVDILNKFEARKEFDARVPFYEEWLTAKCGKYTEEQKKVLYSLSALRAARATIAFAQDKDIPKADGFGGNLTELAQEAELAIQMEKADMLEPYIDLSNIHAKCEDKAANAHVFSFHYSLQEYLKKTFVK